MVRIKTAVTRPTLRIRLIAIAKDRRRIFEVSHTEVYTQTPTQNFKTGKSSSDGFATVVRGFEGRK